MKIKLARLGRVHRKAKTGYLVVRVEDPGKRYRLGLKVVMEGGKEVGRLVDLIGNINSPYALVKLSNKELAEEVPDESVLYLVYPPRGPKTRGRAPSRRGRRGRGVRRSGGKKSRGGK